MYLYAALLLTFLGGVILKQVGTCTKKITELEKLG